MTGEINPRCDTDEGHLEIVRTYRALLGAYAWEQYLTKGRGVVVVSFEAAGDKLTAKMFYMRDGSRELEAVTSELLEEVDVRDSVLTYNPETDFLVVFFGASQSDLDFMDVGDVHPSPPKAFEMGSHRQRLFDASLN